jgi:hypothetical protein
LVVERRKKEPELGEAEPLAQLAEVGVPEVLGEREGRALLAAVVASAV